jgi:L-rhamnose mutarotase
VARAYFFAYSQFPGGDFIFSCRPPQGAVLALPHGAELKRLKNTQIVREYAQKHAKTWYRYLKCTKRLVVDNGSLYLITGCEKVMSWGMAAYHSTWDTDEFQASFRPIQANANPQYQWMGSGRFPAQHKHYNGPFVTDHISNQTVFIHGLSISLGVGIWNHLFSPVKVTTIEEYLLGSTPTRIKSTFQPTLLSSSLFGSSSRGTPPHDRHPAQRIQNTTLAQSPRAKNVCWYRSIVIAANTEQELMHPADFSSWKAH